MYSTPVATLACSDGDVRLVNGSTSMEGRVELCINNTYGTVCDDFWDELEAAVVCTQLEFSSEGAIPLFDGYFGIGTGNILLDDVVCSGQEKSLLDCAVSSMGTHSCTSNEIAGVRCKASCSEGHVRLLLGENDTFYLNPDEHEQFYFLEDELSRGRVEICISGRYGTVCDNSWDNRDASVVCRQLGFAPYGAVAVTSEYYGENSRPMSVKEVECTGSELTLLDCNLESNNQNVCGSLEDAGVVCQDISTPYANCSEGKLRLVDGHDPSEGRVEVCINNAWGTVCSNLFSRADAQVVCTQLGGFQRRGSVAYREPRFGPGSGPIFLDEIHCSGTEKSLLECNMFAPVGIHMCEHFQDVSVHCEDLNECESSNGGCDHICNNTIGSFECNCHDGYLLDLDGFHCLDIDECLLDIHECDVNATCNNTIGDYGCQCNIGFEGDGFTCANIDECLLMEDECHDNAICNDTFGSYDCHCVSGYEGDGFDCTNIDECIRGTFTCHQYAECVDTDGSYTCSCKTGFSGSGLNCNNIDECRLDTHNCSPNAYCTDTVGSYSCSCSDGYHGDGINCTNINECETGEHSCNDNADCMDTDGSYRCTCHMGYEGNGINCTNIDECERGRNDCDVVNGECTDTDGSYICECRPGYEGDGINCTNIDECSRGNHNCHISAECTDSDGSFNCTCNLGFTGDGVNCTCSDGNVMLVGGTNDAEGTIQICYRNTYGTVCDDWWDTLDAMVVCKQLGFLEPVAVPVRSAYFGTGTGPILLDNLYCKGNESSLLECESGVQIGRHNCNHTEDAGIRCEAACTDYNVRLMIGEDYDFYNGELENGDFYYLKDQLSRGRVEVCMNATWGTICHDMWDNKDASVVCRQLGFSPYGAIATPKGQFGEGTLQTLISNVNCTGSESALQECQGTHQQILCENTADAGVVCQERSTAKSNCNDGDVQLVDGGGELQGRVEVCINSAWGTICDNSFDKDDAAVICIQLGFSGSNATAYRRARFGRGVGPIFLDELDCDGTESTLSECDLHAPIGLHTCNNDHSEDAGIRCEDIDECKENNGGCEHICTNVIHSFQCHCYEGHLLEHDGYSCNDINECDVSNGNCSNTCVNTNGSYHCECSEGFELAFDSLQCMDVNECEEEINECDSFADCNNTLGSYICTCKTGYAGNGTTCININECESGYITNCSNNGVCIDIEGSFVCVCNPGYMGDGLNCSCRNGDLRLSDGSTPMNGRVEICIDNVFGTVCDDFWNDVDASVVCKQLGFFANGTHVSEFGGGNGEIFLDDVHCTGNENLLLDCTAKDIGDHNCQHYEDAGVRCQASCLEGSLRLLVGENNSYYLNPQDIIEGHYFQKDELLVGRVEICIGGHYGTICDEYWDSADASVVCGSLGFSPYGSIAETSGAFTEDGIPMVLNDVGCDGTEPTLLNCSHNLIPGISCGPFEDAGVICQEISTTYANCTDGSLRLVNGTTPQDGRVEICINNAWGTICDELYDNTDASVICHQLGGYTQEGAISFDGAKFGSGTGPIFLSRLDCIGAESNLLDCRRFSRLGLHSCSHSQDIGVFCKDIDECATNRGGCDHICTNTIGSFECSCEEGYKLQDDGATCSDIDECLLQLDECDINAACQNVIGSYSCSCNTGYNGNGRNCSNINECDLQIHECDLNAECVDTIGTYTCTCNLGYEGSGFNCTNVDECSSGTHTCHQNAYCTDIIGSFMCTCITGYEGNGKNCSNVDECAENLHSCDFNALCDDTDGSYNCTCNSGYDGDGLSCENIDECEQGTDNCSTNANCTDTDGSYNCTCQSGYEGNGMTCLNINECERRTHNCDINAQCGDAIGSFTCTCEPGYSGNGIACTNIDECSAGTHNCDTNAECADTIGSYLCNCYPGYSGDGLTCTCEDGQLMLLNGSVSSEGRVEICIGNTYGTICDDVWDVFEARVVCRQLGFNGTNPTPVDGGIFGEGLGPILLDDLACSGEEQSLLECTFRVGTHLCDHSEDAGVRCEDFCSDGHVRLAVGDTYTMPTSEYESFYYTDDELSRGRVEICINGAYGTVCDNTWENKDASVVCEQLGFSKNGAIAVQSGPDPFRENFLPTLLANINCTGTERSLLQCGSTTTNEGFTCGSHRDAGVVCQDISTPQSDCSTGKLRLTDGRNITVDGRNTTEGRVEVCINNAWGTICDGAFSAEDAAVICYQLQFDRKDAKAHRGAIFGPGEGPIFMDNLDCTGNESTLLDCNTFSRVGFHSCNHSQDISVSCQDINECEIDNGGCEQNCVNVILSFMCDCNEGYRLEGNGRTCKDVDECAEGNGGCNEKCNNTVGSFHCACTEGFEVATDGKTCIDVNECATEMDECHVNAECNNTIGNYTCACNEGYIGDGFQCAVVYRCDSPVVNCSENTHCIDEVEGFQCVCNEGYTGNGVNCSCSDGSIRLAGNNSRSREGRVEICFNNTYGTVCDNSWSGTDANIVCKQLGFSPTGARPQPGSVFSDVSRPLYLEIPVCSGDELSLVDCQRDLDNSCNHTSDVGVQCEVACSEGKIRIADNSTRGGSIRGRVEVCIGGRYGTICDDLWDTEDSSVVCNQIGFSPYGAIPVVSEYFSDDSTPTLLKDVHCTGVESSLSECENTTDRAQSCGIYQDAGIVCQELSTAGANCSGGDIRLVDSSTHHNVSIGRVEVCINSAWGTICNSEFDDEDAEVICSQLGGYNRESAKVYQNSSSIPGVGPIFISSLACKGTELEVLDCKTNAPLGLHACDHTQDAWVFCQDINECTTGNGNCDQTCINLIGDFKCKCMENYTLDVNGFTCNDINECELNINKCGNNSLCTNTIGGYNCSCISGYEGDGFTCKNIDECDRGIDECDSNAECNDTIGNYECICRPGYDGDGFNCTNIDECELEQDNCHIEATCTDTEGSFNCTCNDGFEGAGTQCENVDECERSTHTCHGNARCNDTYGSFNCTCKTGYEGNGFVNCTNINECDRNTDNCSEDAQCTDRAGSFTCTCNIGYSGDGVTCTNINECVENAHDCDVNARCDDTIGSFNCTCNFGFEGNGTTCINIDECERTLHNCHMHANCIDTIGDFNCTCNRGYNGDGVLCQCTDGDIVLVNGSNRMEGRVEICINNTYGTVCDDRWDILEARVVCQQLGFSPERVVPVHSAYFGAANSSRPIFLDDLGCTGNESQLLECTKGRIGVHDCNHLEDAGVQCEDLCKDGTIRLLIGEEYEYYEEALLYDDYYFIKDELSRGRVEICLNGTYGTVCDDSWSNKDASVVCRQLGFSTYGAIAITSELYRENSLPLLLMDVDCNGSEHNILECSYISGVGRSCGDAGVVCQDILTPYAECTDGSVRLQDGKNVLEGRVEICMNNAWGTVCDNEFSAEDAGVVCHQLGYLRENAEVLQGTVFSEGVGPILLDGMDCDNSEEKLLECRTLRPHGIHQCYHSQDTCIRCKGENLCATNKGGCQQECTPTILNFTCGCYNGYLLIDRFSCRDIDECAENSSLCEHSCNNTEGSYACGCNEGYELSSNGYSCTDTDECQRDMEICIIENAECINIDGGYTCNCSSGYEGDGEINCTNIDECTTGTHTCDLNADCTDIIGGFLCTCHSGYERNGSVCTNIDECRTGEHTCDVNANCTDSDGSFDCTCKEGYMGDGENCTNMDECLLNIHTCDENAYCMDNEGGFFCTCNHGYTGNGFTCSCSYGDVRLVNGSHEKEGRVEICINNQYGTVCDDRWDTLDAKVVCRQLGFPGEDSIPVKRATFGKGTGSIFLDNVVCIGVESSLLECQGNNMEEHNCKHSEDAGVRCEASCTDGAIRLLVGEDNVYYQGGGVPKRDYDVYFYKDDDSDLSRGRTEICIGGSYYTICDEFWDNSDASVACHQLGFSRFGAIAVTTEVFSEPRGPETLPDNIICNGTENTLLECQFNNTEQHTCDALQDAGVVCQDPYTAESNCTHGELRLVNGDTIREGRLEVCINSAWGTVCDNLFGIEEATVVCQELGFSRREAEVRLQSADFGHGSGPIFLDQLDCNGAETSLLECNFFGTLGLHQCEIDHSEDVGVHCEAFCPLEMTNSTRGNYFWPETRAEVKPSFPCKYGTVVGIHGEAIRQCDERGHWEDSNLQECLTLAEMQFRKAKNVTITSENVEETIDLLHDAVNHADNTEDQSEEGLDAVLNVLSDIVTPPTNDTSIAITEEVIEDAVQILSDIQSWPADILENNAARIVESFEKMGTNLIEKDNFTAATVVTSSLAFRGEKMSVKQLQTTGRIFSVAMDKNGILNASFTDANQTQGNISILLPPSLFENTFNQDTDSSVGLFFVLYETAVLLPLASSRENYTVGSPVIGATVIGQSIHNLTEPITIKLQLYNESHADAQCVYWDPVAAGGRGNWSRSGCELVDRKIDEVICSCSHLTNFGITVNSQPVDCEYGQTPTIDRTNCEGIRPPLEITPTDNQYIYQVEAGRRFAVECNSEGNFSGNVTWYRADNTAVTEILVTDEGGSSGSAEGVTYSDGFLSQMNEPNDTEIGQLLAYRRSSDSVILATETNIGIQEIANGLYSCVAENDFEVTVITISVEAVTMNKSGDSTFLRFSVSLQDIALFPSESHVLPSLSFMVLQEFNESIPGQQLIECSFVPRRMVDMQQQLERIECNILNVPDLDSLPLETDAVAQTLNDTHDVIQSGTVRWSEIGFCDFETTITDRGTSHWPETIATTLVSQQCALGDASTPGAVASRKCNFMASWENPQEDSCTTVVTSAFENIAMANVTAESFMEITAQLTSVVRNASNEMDQTAENINVIAQVFTRTVGLLIGGDATVDESFVNDTIGILDGIQDWPEEVVQEQSSMIVNSFELIATNLVEQENFTQLIVKGQDLTFEAKRLDVERLEESELEFTGIIKNTDTTNSSMESTQVEDVATLSLPPSLIRDNVISQTKAGVFFSFYETAVLFPLKNITENDTIDIGTSVIGATVAGVVAENLVDAVMLSFEVHLQNYSDPRCVSWDFESAGGGNWTTEGCRLTNSESFEDTNTVECNCTHLTNFAVLVDIRRRMDKEINDDIEQALSAISIAGAVLSIIGMVVTIITLVGFKKLRQKDATKFDVQLCIAILCALIVFVAGVERTEIYAVCVVVAAMIQYFTLAAMMWMAAEAFLMFQKLVIVFGKMATITTRYIITVSVLCWGLPLVPVVIPVAINRDFIVSPNFCFISDLRVLFGAFLGPIFVIVIFNGIIFITVVRILLKKRKAVQRKAGSKTKGVLKTLISIFAIMMLFGLTWIFGAFTISSASVVFQFLFAITNSFEGFFIFLFLCALREDVRELWKGLICYRNKNKKRRMSAGISYKTRSRQSSLINSSASEYQTKSTSRLQKTGSVYSANSDVCVSENSYALEPHYDSPNVHFELPAIPEEESTLTGSDGSMKADQPDRYQTGTVNEYMLEPCYATIELASNIEESESEDEPICDSEVAPHIAIRHKLSAAMKEIAEKKTKEDEIGLLDHEVAPHIQARMRQVFRNPRLDVDDASMMTCIVNPNAIL